MQTRISKVYEGLLDARAIFIFDFEAACDLALLQSLKIRAVVSVGQEFTHNYPQSIVTNHLKIPAIDTENYPLHAYFDQAFEFIEAAHYETNVLIHCALGVSRSATIFLAYLFRKKQIYLHLSIRHCQAAKIYRILYLIQVYPNKGFQQLLQQYSLRFGATLPNPQPHNPESSEQPRPKKLMIWRGLSLGNKSSGSRRPQRATQINNELKSLDDLRLSQNEDNICFILERKTQVESKLREIQGFYSRKSSSRGRRALGKVNSLCIELEENKGGVHYNGCSAEF